MQIPNIIPNFQPLSLLKANEKKAEESVGAFLVLVDKEGDLYYDGCGVTRENLIYALRKFEHEILSEE